MNGGGGGFEEYLCLPGMEVQYLFVNLLVFSFQGGIEEGGSEPTPSPDPHMSEAFFACTYCYQSMFYLQC